jgi:NAD(P)-dependent dehydrogenase (short-subunit alcohol dehydrogenase family)
VTGEADRIDGPYFAFKLIQRLRGSLPEWWPMIGPEGGELNLVPVDFVARALDHIAHQPGLDGRTFHIVDPHPLSLGDTINEFCRAAHAPEFTLRIDRRATALIPSGFRETLERWPAFQTIRAQVLQGIHIPEAVLAYTRNRARFTCGETLRALDAAGIKCPPLHSYAWRIWDYWERHLDPHIPNERNLRRLLQDKVVLVTGASSGIGRAVAMRLSSYGAVMVLVSRQEDKLQEVRADIVAAGGRAHVRPTDLTDLDAIDAMARDVLAEHGKVDVLINNAGRSIRRAVEHEYERFHDFTRTMQLNYFGSLRLILAVLPGMRERGEGHIINISSIGVQAFPPRFSAYVASKAALAGFSRCMAAEVAHDGVAVTNIHMPLINTPMIAPTTMYQFIPVGETNEAADLVVEALLKRPPEMGTRLGKLGEAVDVLAPGFLQLVMTGAYHLFPESGRLRDGKEGEEPSTEAIALSYLLRGIHF